MKLIACRLAGSVLREEVLNGRRHIVVPVVAMVEGVHQGIVGPGQPGPRSFYSFSELSRAVDSLLGVAATLYHPMTDSELVSASSPAGQPFVIGQMHNVRAENNRLLAEAWLDVEQLTSMSPETLAGLHAGTPMEVSLGVFADAVATIGNWFGETYDEIMTNIRFDHLALLPGASGACSWADGCGVRANQKKPQVTKEADMPKEKLSVLQKMTRWASHVMERLTANEASHGDIRDKLWNFVNALDTPEFINYLREVYDDYFIYETSRREVMTGVTVATKCYKRSYSVSTEGVVTIAEAPEEVIENTEYVPVDTTTANSTINKESVVKDQLIKDLIACDRNPFSEEDRPMLTGLSECQLKKLNADNFKPAVAPTVVAAAPTAPVAAPTVVAAAPAKQETVEEYLSHAPTEVAEPIKRMMARETAAKDDLIKSITANQGCLFTEADLKLKDLTELSKLAGSIGIKVNSIADYSGQAGAPNANQGSKVPAMPSTAPLPTAAAAK